MAAPELLHSAPEIPRQLGELSQLFSPDSLHHLSDTLRSLGHPYGLLLTQSNSSTTHESLLNAAHHSQNARQESLRDPLGFLSIGGSLALPSGLSAKSSGASSDESHSLDSSFNYLSTKNNDILVRKSHIPEDDAGYLKENLSISIFGGGFGSLIVSWPFSAGFSGDIIEQAKLFAPSLLILTNRHEVSLKDKPREFHIGKRSAAFGSASLKLSTYRGQESFTIKTPDGQPVAEIQPGSPLAALHVSHQAARFRRLSPLEKAHAMVEDVTQLLSAIDHTNPTTLNPDQQTTLAKAKDATIIGISHLVRLFRRQTGLPTWKLDVLPPLLQRFHALDSQAVSTQFGGKRKVNPSDIEMLVITPSQRRQLLADLQV